MRVSAYFVFPLKPINFRMISIAFHSFPPFFHRISLWFRHFSHGLQLLPRDVLRNGGAFVELLREALDLRRIFFPGRCEMTRGCAVDEKNIRIYMDEGIYIYIYVFYYVILYYNILYYMILYYILWNYILLYYIILYKIIYYYISILYFILYYILIICYYITWN